MPEDCCALEPGHDGCCAHVCPECDGSQRCPECNDESVEDFGGCGTCDSAGGCHFCYEGMIVDGAHA